MSSERQREQVIRDIVNGLEAGKAYSPVEVAKLAPSYNRMLDNTATAMLRRMEGKQREDGKVLTASQAHKSYKWS